MTAAHPTLVRRPVFAGGACFGPAGFHPELADAGCQGTPDDLVGTSWHAAYERVAPDRAGWPSLVAKVGQLDAGFGGWRPDEIAAMSMPVLLVVGDADIVRLEHVVEMFSLLGGAWPVIRWASQPSRLAILPGRTHVSLLDRTAWLAAMTDDFLGLWQAEAPATRRRRRHTWVFLLPLFVAEQQIGEEEPTGVAPNRAGRGPGRGSARGGPRALAVHCLR